MDNHDVVVEEDRNASKVHQVSVNEEDAGSIATKYHDMERKILEGKLILVRDDGVRLKHVNADSQATILVPSLTG